LKKQFGYVCFLRVVWSILYFIKFRQVISAVVETVTSATWLKPGDRDFIKKSETRYFKIGQIRRNLSRIFQKISSPLARCNSVERLAFSTCCGFSFLADTLTVNRLNVGSFAKPLF